MDYTKIKDLVSEHRRIEEEIRKELIDIFDAMPENEECENISSSPRCFTVKTGIVSQYNVLSPEFYDFPRQWQRMQKILRSDEDFATQLNTLEKIALTGKCQIREGGQRITYQFHPDVIDKLRIILKGDYTNERSA